MIKNTERLNQLFISHLGQSAPDLEQEEFWGYVNDPMFEEEVKELIAGIYSNPENVSMISEEERNSILAQVFSTQRNAPLKIHSTKLWPRIAGIAAAVIGIAICTWFYTNEIASSRKVSRNDVVYAQDIVPGKNTATLTINGGEAITLSEAKSAVVIDASQIKYNDGTAVISKVERNLLNSKGKRSLGSLEMTLSTPRGGTYQVRLPDGTNVWLNAASSLTYTTVLKERRIERVVRLNGEAYFEVAPAYTSSPKSISRGGERPVKQPFVVETSKQTVEVLGTHFNVNSYEEDGVTKTTLAEGSVKVTSSKNSNAVVLMPGQQAIHNFNEIKVKTVDLDAELAWRNDMFNFKGQDFKTMMRAIGRWYNVEVDYEYDPGDLRLRVQLPRSTGINNLLKYIQSTGVVKLKIEGRRISVIK